VFFHHASYVGLCCRGIILDFTPSGGAPGAKSDLEPLDQRKHEASDFTLEVPLAFQTLALIVIKISV
jgi:hypothetical protein